jgi:hypothetical protein
MHEQYLVYKEHSNHAHSLHTNAEERQLRVKW